MRRGIYGNDEVNSHYFAKGEWRSIAQRRQDFELKIHYTADGSSTVSTQGESY